jgi:hypothetical protein
MRGTTAAPNKEEIRRNLRAVAHAIAQQELEGLDVPESTIADLERVARGELDTDDIIRSVYRRFGNDQIFRPR